MEKNNFTVTLKSAIVIKKHIIVTESKNKVTGGEGIWDLQKKNAAG